MAGKHSDHYFRRWVTLSSTSTLMYLEDIGLRNLKTVEFFIVSNYAPMLFAIKSRPSLTSGTRHYCQRISRSLSRRTSAGQQSMLTQENVLSLLGDDSEEVRTKAVEQITQLR